jgi:hypothetical protein
LLVTVSCCRYRRTSLEPGTCTTVHCNGKARSSVPKQGYAGYWLSQCPKRVPGLEAVTQV